VLLILLVIIASTPAPILQETRVIRLQLLVITLLLPILTPLVWLHNTLAASVRLRWQESITMVNPSRPAAVFFDVLADVAHFAMRTVLADKYGFQRSGENSNPINLLG